MVIPGRPCDSVLIVLGSNPTVATNFKSNEIYLYNHESPEDGSRTNSWNVALSPQTMNNVKYSIGIINRPLFSTSNWMNTYDSSPRCIQFKVQTHLHRRLDTAGWGVTVVTDRYEGETVISCRGSWQERHEFLIMNLTANYKRRYWNISQDEVQNNDDKSHGHCVLGYARHLLSDTNGTWRNYPQYHLLWLPENVGT
jgi:hypothetical protein